MVPGIISSIICKTSTSMERLFFGRFLSEFEAVGWMRLLKKNFDAGLRTLKDSEPDLFFSPPPPPLFIFSRLSYQLHLERVLIAILVRFSMTQDVVVG